MRQRSSGERYKSFGADARSLRGPSENCLLGFRVWGLGLEGLGFQGSSAEAFTPRFVAEGFRI